jgi:plasmid stability protein
VASITIRDLDPELKARLRVRAAQHGRSMEEEVRVILRAAIAERAPAEQGLATAIRRLFEPLGGVELDLPPREPMPPPPKPR